MWIIAKKIDDTDNYEKKDILINLSQVKTVSNVADYYGKSFENQIFLEFGNNISVIIEGTLEDVCYAIRTLEERGKVIRLHE